MNKVILMGRLTRDPEVKYSQGENPMAIAKYSLAVDRRGRSSGNGDEQTADFINVTAFGKAGEFAEKYFRKGTKVLVTGRIQTGSYTNKDGVKVYTTDVIAEDQEFAENKKTGNTENQPDISVPEGANEEAELPVSHRQSPPVERDEEGFTPVNDEDGGLPFKIAQ